MYVQMLVRETKVYGTIDQHTLASASVFVAEPNRDSEIAKDRRKNAYCGNKRSMT